MFGGLLIVAEGRLAHVPGDASFDRLGVPALGVGCDWNFWKKEKDIAPLVLAANEKQLRLGHRHETVIGSPSDLEAPTSVVEPFPPFNPHLDHPCTCQECIGSRIEAILQQREVQYAPLPTYSNTASTGTGNTTSSTINWCCCEEWSNSVSFTPSNFNGNDTHIPRRRYPHRRRRYEVAFPTARAYLNGGTPLSKASRAYIKPFLHEASPTDRSNGSFILQDSHSHAVTRFREYTQPVTPLSSPPSLTYSQGSPTSMYGATTPYSQMVSGDSTMALLPNTPLSAGSDIVYSPESPLALHGGYAQLPSSESSRDSWDWRSIQADLITAHRNGGVF